MRKQFPITVAAFAAAALFVSHVSADNTAGICNSIVASGMRPRRMIPEARPAEADAYVHPNTCGYIKSLLASLVAEGASETAGLVLANSCDGMRRLSDICRARLNTVPQFFIEVPKKKDRDSIEFFASELKRFQANLESQYPGVKITDDGLRAAVRE